MSGLIELILNRRFGAPMEVPANGYSAHVWNAADEARRCKLYYGLDWQPEFRASHRQLGVLYGDSFGGLLLRDSLKIASLVQQEVWAIYRIDELQARPEVQRALELERSVDFFMDAANVWYYGFRGEELYCYDAENDELDCLGEAEKAIDDVIDQWLSAVPD